MKKMVYSIITLVLLSGCIPKALIETQPYDFRKTRWGYTKEMVMSSEQGKRLHVKKGNLIIYNHNFGHVQAKVVYCFQDNRLTAAGYITDKPIKDVEIMFNQSIKKHGKPTEKRIDGLRWDLERSVIYANAYVSRHDFRGIPQYSIGGGIIDHLYSEQEEEAGIIRYWDCVWAYIDRSLYDRLHNERFPLDRLSFYEKLLFGVVKRTSRAAFASDIEIPWESIEGLDVDVEEQLIGK